MAAQIITTILKAETSGDLTDLQTIKDELGVTAPDFDALFARWITLASQLAEAYCNRVFPLQTYQDQFWPQRDPFRWAMPGGVMPVQLTQWPIVRSSVANLGAPAAPSLTAVVGGSLPATTYYVKITYSTAAGESVASLETSLLVGAGNLLKVSSPVSDAGALATGWNVYVSNFSGQQTLQNGATPITIGTAWTMPAAGLVAGGGMPSPTITENAVTLYEGVDYSLDTVKGQITRLDGSLYPIQWSALPITVQYQAGYATIPVDVADAVILLVKHRWFARQRDPYLRQESITGVYEAQYWIAQGPGSSGALPPDVQDMLDNYRVPVVA